MVLSGAAAAGRQAGGQAGAPQVSLLYRTPSVPSLPPQVWHTAPVHANGWALLGELSKYVPVSEARVQSVKASTQALFVAVRGQAGEAVPLTFWDSAQDRATTVACVLDAAGRATAAVPAGTCE